jgi:putative lipoprotein
VRLKLTTMETEYSGARLAWARLLSCLTVLLLFCSLGHAQTGSAQVTGSVTYRERIALPRDAVIDVQLADVSGAEVAAQTVAYSLINAEGRQVPVPFILTFDPALIVPAHHYSVRATIRSGDGMMMFSTTQAYPVLTHGAPSKVNLVLHMVGRGGKHVSSEKKQPEPAASEETASASEAASKTAESTAEPASAAVTPPAGEPSPSSPAAGSNAQPTEQPPAAPPTTGSEQTSQASASSAEQTESRPAESEPAVPPPTPAESAPSKNTAPAPEAASQPSAAQSAEPAPSTAGPATQEQAPPAEPSSTASTAAAEPPASQPEASATSEAQVAAPESQPPPATSESTPESAAPSQTEATAPSPEAKSSESTQPLPEAPSVTKEAELTSVLPESMRNEPEPEPEPEPKHESSRPLAVTGSTPLANTQWRLIQLEGRQVVITPPQRPITLAFSPQGTRIAGSAGCNSYLGSFHDSHGHLELDPGAMTLMACADPAGTRERKFVAMLRSADGYKISGDYLLLTSNGKTVAKFINNPEQ